MAVSAALGVKVAVEPLVTMVAVVFEPAPAAFNVKLVAVSVAGSIATLKFATTVVVGATAVADASGVTEVTVGAGAVVKVQVKVVPKGTADELVTVLRIVAV